MVSESNNLLRVDILLSKAYPHVQVGHYILVNVPTISRAEWHPFSVCLTQAVDGKQVVTLCVMCVGKWTRKFRDTTSVCSPVIHVDGPYSSPAIGMPHKSIIVGIGQGVNPYLSFLGAGPTGVVYK